MDFQNALLPRVLRHFVPSDITGSKIIAPRVYFRHFVPSYTLRISYVADEKKPLAVRASG